MAYTLLPNGYVQRQRDGVSIPPDPANRDYAEYLAWKKKGNTAAPLAAPSLEQLKADALEALDRHAGELRRPFISVIPGQEATYLKKEAEAKRWLDAGSPADTGPVGSYPYAEAEAAQTGVTVADTLANFGNQAAFMDGINVQIEAVRIHAKARVAAAASAEGVAAAVEAAAWPSLS